MIHKEIATRVLDAGNAYAVEEAKEATPAQ